MSKKIAIFASGSGSNAENIINYFANNEAFSFPLIVSNKANAYVHERASNLGVLSVTFDKQSFEQGDAIIDVLHKYDIDAIVLAGFLLKISPAIVAAFPQKIVNIHPALLPKHGGKGMYGDNVHKAVVANADTETGITIHYVNENYDEGAIVFQAKCEVTPTDTYETVAAKVHELEYKHFPEQIEKIFG